MKLKQVESALQDVSGFDRPKVRLEQYETPAHIAARLVFTAEASYGDLRDKTVADLGCGCGMLTLGSLLMGAGVVTGFDIDEDALSVCQDNLEELLEEGSSVELVQADVKQLMVPGSRWHGRFDTVLLNPPFGTKKNQGADMLFLEAASALSTSAVYSLHKTSTRAHVLRRARDFGLRGEVLAELRYNLPNTLAFHKKASVDVQVDFVRFQKVNK